MRRAERVTIWEQAFAKVLQDESPGPAWEAVEYISSTDHESEIEELARELDARADEAYEVSNDLSVKDLAAALARGRAFREAAQLLLRDRVGQGEDG